jgi:hypothetical protein
MLEPPRVGLPNIVGQGELVARTRGAQAGAAEAVRGTVAASIQQESIRKAEQLPRAERVDAIGKDHEHTQDGRRHGGERTADDHGLDDDDADGHLLDVVA